MKTIDDLRKSIQGQVDYIVKRESKLYGIYFNGKRVPFTTNEYVSYSSIASAYKAMIQHGKFQYGFLDANYHVNVNEYKKVIDELISTGELEIKLIQ